jgi:hypothetical protein
MTKSSGVDDALAAARAAAAAAVAESASSSSSVPQAIGTPHRADGADNDAVDADITPNIKVRGVLRGEAGSTFLDFAFLFFSSHTNLCCTCSAISILERVASPIHLLATDITNSVVVPCCRHLPIAIGVSMPSST